MKKQFFTALPFLLPMSLGAQSTTTQEGTIKFQNPLQIKSIDGLLEVLIDRVLIPLAIPIAIVIFIWIGFMYIKAQGKPEEISKVHKALLWTMIGLAIILAAKGLLMIIKGTITEVSTQLR